MKEFIQIGQYLGIVLSISTLAIILSISIYGLLFFRNKTIREKIEIFRECVDILEEIICNKVKSLSEEDINILLGDDTNVAFVISEIMGDIYDSFTVNFITTIEAFVNFEKLTVDMLYNNIRRMYDDED